MFMWRKEIFSRYNFPPSYNLNNYFLCDGFFPLSIPPWIYLSEKERDFSGIGILPRKLVHLQLGLKRLLWLFSPCFGRISLLRKACALLTSLCQPCTRRRRLPKSQPICLAHSTLSRTAVLMGDKNAVLDPTCYRQLWMTGQSTSDGKQRGGGSGPYKWYPA